MIEALRSAIELAQQKFADIGQQATDHIKVLPTLVALLGEQTWSARQTDFFHAWMKKIDIAKTHYLSYQLNWKIGPDRVKINAEGYELTGLVALKFLLTQLDIKNNPEQFFKTANVIFKILNHQDKIFGIKEKQIVTYLKATLRSLKTINYESTASAEKTTNQPLTLPITVLFSEGPIARAYLETIHELGFRVNKLIKLVSSVDLVSKKPVAPMLPGSMRINYAANKQYKQMFYWPNQLKNKKADVVNHLQQQVASAFGFKFETLNHALANQDLNKYAVEVESLFITGLKDSVLFDKIMHETSPLYLYTGGGIVPDGLLTMDNKRLIHIHPGYLPDIRGADCVLWSQLIYRRLSASAFFLAPGIDVGDVIRPCWLPTLNFNMPSALKTSEKYRLIYGFVDPWVRSYVLKELIQSLTDFSDIPSVPQDESDGMTYHFMHEEMKKIAIESFA